MIFKIALIDADRIVMGAGFGSEKVIKGELVHLEPLNHALYKAKMILEKIKDNVKADKYKLFLGDTKTKHFRYKIATTLPYKGTRKKTKRPEYEEDIRKYLIDYHGAEVVTGVEVDDALGIVQMRGICNLPDCSSGRGREFNCHTLENPSIICSNDKDLDMIPGWHYDIDWGIERVFGDKVYKLKSHRESPMYFVSDPGSLTLYKSENGKNKLYGGGQLWFCAQLLMGDKVDNIPGCPKSSRGTYGDVSAYEALKDCKTYEEGIKRVWGCYKEANLTKERLFEVAQLLWIKRKAKGDKIFLRSWLE